MSSFATKSHHFSPDYGQNAVEWLNYFTKEEIDTESNVKKSHKTVCTHYKMLQKTKKKVFKSSV